MAAVGSFARCMQTRRGRSGVRQGYVHREENNGNTTGVSTRMRLRRL